jgi:hypothetical protein
LLDQDLGWIARLQDERLSFDTCHAWLSRIDALAMETEDRRERKLLDEARARVQAALRGCTSHP